MSRIVYKNSVLLAIFGFLIIATSALGAVSKHIAKGEVINLNAEQNKFVLCEMGDKCVTNPDIQVTPKQKIKFVFKNDDVAPHNLILPEMDLQTKTVRDGDSVALEFEAPEKEGVYEYTCSIHPFRMSGKFIVQKE